MIFGVWEKGFQKDKRIKFKKKTCTQKANAAQNIKVYIFNRPTSLQKKQWIEQLWKRPLGYSLYRKNPQRSQQPRNLKVIILLLTRHWYSSDTQTIHSLDGSSCGELFWGLAGAPKTRCDTSEKSAWVMSVWKDPEQSPGRTWRTQRLIQWSSTQWNSQGKPILCRAVRRKGSEEGVLQIQPRSPWLYKKGSLIITFAGLIILIIFYQHSQWNSHPPALQMDTVLGPTHQTNVSA